MWVKNKTKPNEKIMYIKNRKPRHHNQIDRRNYGLSIFTKPYDFGQEGENRPLHRRPKGRIIILCTPDPFENVNYDNECFYILASLLVFELHILGGWLLFSNN